jgi:hypothetical protein
MYSLLLASLHLEAIIYAENLGSDEGGGNGGEEGNGGSSGWPTPTWYGIWLVY